MKTPRDQEPGSLIDLPTRADRHDHDQTIGEQPASDEAGPDEPGGGLELCDGEILSRFEF